MEFNIDVREKFRGPLENHKKLLTRMVVWELTANIVDHR